MGGSVLTFSGATPSRVGSLKMTGARNQLVTYKSTNAGSSVPLNVTGVAVDTGASLAVGATSNAAVDDAVLRINSDSVSESTVNGCLTNMVARESNLHKVGRSQALTKRSCWPRWAS